MLKILFILVIVLIAVYVLVASYNIGLFKAQTYFYGGSIIKQDNMLSALKNFIEDKKPTKKEKIHIIFDMDSCMGDFTSYFWLKNYYRQHPQQKEKIKQGMAFLLKTNQLFRPQFNNVMRKVQDLVDSNKATLQIWTAASGSYAVDVIQSIKERYPVFNKAVVFKAENLKQKASKDMNSQRYQKLGYNPERVIFFDDNISNGIVRNSTHETLINVKAINFSDKKIKQMIKDIIRKDSL